MKTPFEDAVTVHGATVLRVCRAVLGYGPDADDAWSETFLAALRAWRDQDQSTNVEAWLVRIAQRKVVDLLRARQRRAVPTAKPLDGFVAEFPAGAEFPVGAAIPAGAADSADIWDAVAALPERQRLAIAYHYFGGLPHAETAIIVGGSADAVRRAAADGLKTLRHQYGVAARKGRGEGDT